MNYDDLSNIVHKPWKLVKFQTRNANWTFQFREGCEVTLAMTDNDRIVKAIPQQIAEHLHDMGVVKIYEEQKSAGTQGMFGIIQKHILPAFPESQFRTFHIEGKYLFIVDIAPIATRMAEIPYRSGRHEIRWPKVICASEMKDDKLYVMDPPDDNLYHYYRAEKQFAFVVDLIADTGLEHSIAAFARMLFGSVDDSTKRPSMLSKIGKKNLFTTEIKKKIGFDFCRWNKE